MRYLLALCMLALTVQAHAQDARLYFDVATQDPADDTVRATLFVEGTVLAGLVDVALAYDARNLQLEAVEPATFPGTDALLAASPDRLPDNDGTLRLTTLFATGLQPEAAVAHLTFSVVEDADLGISTLQVRSATVTDVEGIGLSITAEDGMLVLSTDVEDEDVPSAFALHPNYPNPFNPSTTLRYDLPEAHQVRLEVYDILGRRVALLLDGQQASGAHRTTWDAPTFASGVYFARMTATSLATAQQQVKVQKMLLVK
ncbi:MAG: T9SS type A sorting domain-containing protein [Bacteroidota bacterium]